MSQAEPFAPHETRMLALEMAVEFINGDKTKSVYSAENVIRTAQKFEAYLTATPIGGYDVSEIEADESVDHR